MLDIGGLRSLLGMDVSPTAPCITVFSEKDGPRLEFVCGFIFNVVLNVNFKITTSLSEKDRSGHLLNYSQLDIPGCFQIKPQGLLFEKNITEHKPVPFFREGKICFFKSPDDLGYDIFASAFYFISRYEEWQKFVPDQHGRFEITQSILYKNKQHLFPVVDQWIIELKEALKDKFPELQFPKKEFKIISTIDVDNLFAYRSKGLVRTFGAIGKDILTGKLKVLRERVLVLRNKRKDPFDIYEEISDFCFEHKILLIYFFLFRSGTKYDRTLDPRSPEFLKVFDILKKNKAVIGIHPSYFSPENDALMKDEITDLSQRSENKILFSRQHYLRFRIHTTPKDLLENGIRADFTMGYASAPGFRAGTSHPFYYYDLSQEKKTELLFVPFCAMDGAYTIYKRSGSEEAMDSLQKLATEIKKTDGIFMTVFHERTFSNHLYNGFGSLYKKLHEGLKE